MSNVWIEDKFGKVEIDTLHPQVTSLFLRNPDGSLSAKSILSRHPLFKFLWPYHAYSYIVHENGQRYESRLSTKHTVEEGRASGRPLLRISNIELLAINDFEPPVVEDWEIRPSDDGSELVWRITQRWKKAITLMSAGTPGLFFNMYSDKYNPGKNMAVHSIWYDPERLDGRFDPFYWNGPAGWHAVDIITKEVEQTVKDRDAWAIYKLFTNFECRSDLKVQVEGGHLYRRGTFCQFSEAGAVADWSETRWIARTPSETNAITVRLSPVDQAETGYQLEVSLPDKALERSARDFYGSQFNGGCLCDNAKYLYGNNTDGYLVGVDTYMFGYALAAGVPASGLLSARPMDHARAYRGCLKRHLDSVNKEGRTCVSSYQENRDDGSLIVLLGIHAYLLHTGDLEFVKSHLAILERMLDFYTRHRENGLFREYIENPAEINGSNWGLDTIFTNGGFNSYYNAFYYKAVLNLAEMEEACGHDAQGREYRLLAQEIREAFNRTFWREDAFGPENPGYIDWIDHTGKPHCYFYAFCQYPPIAFGLASKEQARKIVATADRRIADLKIQYGYPGVATLDNLWPVPPEYTVSCSQPFGQYCNGGMLLSETYWEVVARVKAGDADGAYERLKLFFERAAQTKWIEEVNAWTIKGKPQGNEPYLSDAIIVPVALINGLFGINMSWNKLEVTPSLPSGWEKAAADILYKGQRYRIEIDGAIVNKFQINP